MAKERFPRSESRDPNSWGTGALSRYIGRDVGIGAPTAKVRDVAGGGGGRKVAQGGPQGSPRERGRRHSARKRAWSRGNPARHPPIARLRANPDPRAGPGRTPPACRREARGRSQPCPNPAAIRGGGLRVIPTARRGLRGQRRHIARRVPRRLGGAVRGTRTHERGRVKPSGEDSRKEAPGIDPRKPPRPARLGRGGKGRGPFDLRALFRGLPRTLYVDARGCPRNPLRAIRGCWARPPPPPRVGAGQAARVPQRGKSGGVPIGRPPPPRPVVSRMPPYGTRRIGVAGVDRGRAGVRRGWSLQLPDDVWPSGFLVARKSSILSVPRVFKFEQQISTCARGYGLSVRA